MAAHHRVLLLLFLAHVALCDVPPEWSRDNTMSQLLYVPSDADLPASQMPAIGNGYLATQIGSDAIYVAGVYNGAATTDPSHRARVPSTVNFRAPGISSHAALNLREATYYRRSSVPPYKDAWFGYAACGPWWANTVGDSCTSSSNQAWLEQRWYAHRLLRSVLVHEIEAIGEDHNLGERMERFVAPYYIKLCERTSCESTTCHCVL